MTGDQLRQTMQLRPGAGVILNLGLDPAYGTDQTVGQRLRVYHHGLREVMLLLHSELHLGNEETEATLVAVGFFSEFINKTTEFWDMLIAARQDCAAILYTEDNFGVLYGPRADRWGEFLHEFFHKPERFKT